MKMDFTEGATIGLTLIDETGRQAKNMVIIKGSGVSTYNLDIHDLQSGIYIAQTQMNGVTQTQKIVKLGK